MNSQELAVVVFGLPGAGKSEVAKKISKRTESQRLNTDVLRKIMYPHPTYRSDESQKMYEALVYVAGQELSQRRTVVVDGTFNSQPDRESMILMARRRNAELRMVHVTCSDEELIRERLLCRPGTGNPSDADWRVYQKVKAKFAPITDPCMTIDNTGRTLQELDEILAISGLWQYLNLQNH